MGSRAEKVQMSQIQGPFFVQWQRWLGFGRIWKSNVPLLTTELDWGPLQGGLNEEARKGLHIGAPPIGRLHTQPCLQMKLPDHDWVISIWVVDQTTRAVAKTTSCSPQTDRKAQDNTYTTHCTWRSWLGAFRGSSTLHSRVFGMGRYCVGDQKKNINTDSAAKLLLYNAFLPEKYASAIVALSLWD